VALDPVRANSLAEVRDIGLNDIADLFWRLIAPDLIHQSRGRDKFVRSDQKMRQHCPLLRAAERDRAAPRVDLYRPQEAELHRRSMHQHASPRAAYPKPADLLESDRQDVDGI
jgi:hypothetical protein